MAHSGNHPRRRARPPKNGDRLLSNGDPGTDGVQDEPAAEQARERLAEESPSGQEHQSDPQRAWSSGHSTQHVKADGSASRRKSAKDAPKRSTAMAAGIFGTVLVMLAVIVLVSVTGKKAPSTAPSSGRLGMQPAPATVANAISHVPQAAFAEAGTTITSSGPYTDSITVLKDQPSMTRDGKPLVAYIGSNWCPYCAATRWPFAIALSRFGRFKGLRVTASGEINPGIATLSFYGSTYTSRYIAFLATEQCTDILSSSTSAAVEACNGYEPLQSLSPTAHKILLKYDFPPYVSSANEGGIPFIDFANKFLEDGTLMDPTILTGLTHVQIARSLADPVASPAQTILVTANYYTAGICKLTNNKPGSVCKTAVVEHATGLLKP